MIVFITVTIDKLAQKKAKSQAKAMEALARLDVIRL